MKELSMKPSKGSRVLAVSLAILVYSGSSASPHWAQKPAPGAPAKAVQQTKKATALLEQAMAKPEQRIPKALLTKATAVAVLTDVKKVGMLIEGVASGRGVVTRRFPDGHWSAPVFIHLGAVSIGPQLNASNFSVILLFMNDGSADWLLNNKAVMFDRTKAPVAGPVGEIKVEQKEVVPVADVFSYVFDDGRLEGKELKNLFSNVGLSFDNDLNKATYGVKAAAVLADAEGKKVPRAQSEMNQFSETVGRYFARE
jgi:lipid-binding SYLF domain-containing protein